MRRDPKTAGPIEWQLVEDGAMAYPREVIFAGVAPADLDRAGITGEVVTPYNALVVRASGRLILVDAGLGAVADAIGAPAGRLASSLAALGIAPTDVDDVIVTHGHADHVGGLTAGSRPSFPRARHHLARTEWAFWMDGDPRPRLPAPLADLLADTARATFGALRDAGLLALIDDDLEVVPGVRLLGAPGHTPGHLAVELDNGGDPLLYAADAVVHELQFEHPDWTAAVDVDAQATVRTRRRLLDAAADRGALVAAFHIGPIGAVTRAGDAYRFTPRDVT
jgi:glyoxylase-like metal-dependent hydrolase (beta-lactamase superfamily II)